MILIQISKFCSVIQVLFDLLKFDFMMDWKNHCVFELYNLFCIWNELIIMKSALWGKFWGNSLFSFSISCCMLCSDFKIAYWWWAELWCVTMILVTKSSCFCDFVKLTVYFKTKNNLILFFSLIIHFSYLIWLLCFNEFFQIQQEHNFRNQLPIWFTFSFDSLFVCSYVYINT
jgi:hypothetical protein